MQSNNIEQNSILLDKVVDLIDRKIQSTQKGVIEQFIRYFYSSLSFNELSGRSVNDLYGAGLSMSNFCFEHAPEQLRLSVFNPSFEQHGWQSTHTIIQLHHRDIPFLLDSVRMELYRLGVTIHQIINLPLAVTRDESGAVVALAEEGDNYEIILMIEIDRETDNQVLDGIAASLRAIIADVELTYIDWQQMTTQMADVVSEIEGYATAQVDSAQDCLSFLRWLVAQHFIFMGFRYYDIKAKQGDYHIIQDVNSSLGIMKNSAGRNAVRKLSSLSASAQSAALSNQLITITKTSTRSKVHRPVNLDYIGIKRFNKQGAVIGEYRFIGLFTSAAYNSSPLTIPLLDKKIEQVLQLSQLNRRGHDYRDLLNILETFPRDDLFQIAIDELLNIAMGILHIKERHTIRLFVRPDPFGRFVSCLVYVPKELYNTQLRLEIQSIFQKAFSTTQEVSFSTHFSESILARAHFVVALESDAQPHALQYDVKTIEASLIEATKSWDDRLRELLLQEYGEAKGRMMQYRYASAFTSGYKDEVVALKCLVDIQHIELLSEQNPMGMMLYHSQESGSSMVRFRLYHQDPSVSLSDILPILENMGLRVLGERPFTVSLLNDRTVWILDFSMQHKDALSFELEQVKAFFQDAFARIWQKDCDNDGFNYLILAGGLSWHEVTILRAYAKYMRQIGSSFSQSYIERALAKNPDLAVQLVHLFKLRFALDVAKRDAKYQKLLGKIEAALEQVVSLDDDRIIRRFVELIEATVRTNYFQILAQAPDTYFLSLKLMPEALLDIPLPIPEYEIFVYSPRFEGVHLRGGKVARGGLRWSDRLEDFRTEVLGLVKAQQVKNAVIVPVGAKGGFVCKQPPDDMSRAALQQEGIACYKLFITALLSITDNLKQGKVIKPTQVYCLDDDDPYLVVAADKGTASFSDIANEIALQQDFWLGDAFASGGSAGYDHKKMGITARGAWESVKRHFREMGRDIQTSVFSVVGIGDMAGDVFGNGMLLSGHIQLKAAFNHMHIFIDPNPDVESSFNERQRLFNSVAGWGDYNAQLISAGGGVFSRQAKSIKLSAEIQQWLKTDKQSMAPNDLIKAILVSEYDLLWNGGIGTFVKSQQEAHGDVGDRANDAIRVNAVQLRCHVIGEGGNLGCTQLGRVEFALNGGRINTDSIDNSAGVDCSDNEVNLKILLNEIMRNGDMTLKQRNVLLRDMTVDVADTVLQHNYMQTLSISVTELYATKMVKELMRFMSGLERSGRLNRELEYLPADEVLLERITTQQGFVRPELAVLMSYAKMELKQSLCVSEITQDPFYADYLRASFPSVIGEKHHDALLQHQLRGEIIAMELANEMIHFMGANFAYRIRDESGADIVDIARSYSIASEVFMQKQLYTQIAALDNQVESAIQLEMLSQLRRYVRRATLWFLRRRDKQVSLQQNCEHYLDVIQQISERSVNCLPAHYRERFEENATYYQQNGVPEAIAIAIAQLELRLYGLDIADISQSTGTDVTLCSSVFYLLGDQLELHWFLEAIVAQPVDNHWQALARSAFREELDWQHRSLATAVITSCQAVCDAEQRIQLWMSRNETVVARWHEMLADFRASGTHEFAKFSVVLRELLALVQSCHLNIEKT